MCVFVALISPCVHVGVLQAVRISSFQSAFNEFLKLSMRAIGDLRARWRAAVTKRSLCVCENDDDLRARWRAAVTGNS